MPKTKKAPPEITAYTHPAQAVAQEPDTAPGPYYVTCTNDSRVALVSGPYDKHADAIAVVPMARALIRRHDAWSDFYAFGTVRMKETCTTKGGLQQWGYPLFMPGDEMPETPAEMLK